MRYCVIKNTTIVIDGSENHDEIMYKNAQSSGFATDQVEVLTQEQYEARKVSEPASITLDADTILNAKIEVQTINTLIDLGVI